MKMKNLFKFFCMMALIVLGQNALAADDVITRSFLWTEDKLDPEQLTDADVTREGDKTVFLKTTKDGVQVRMVSDSNVTRLTSYITTGWAPRRFALGSVGAYGATDATLNGAISWSVPSKEFRIVVSSVTATAKVGGNQCYFSLGGNDSAEVDVDETIFAYYFHSFVPQTDSSIIEEATYVPFRFYAGPSRTATKEKKDQAAIQRIGMTYAVYPYAPVWDGDSMLITVDSTNLHWYVLADHFTVADAFAGTLKFDVKVARGDEKYMFWNEDSTAFYMLKKMDFEIKAWVDPYQGEWDDDKYEYVGGYNASEVTTQVITSVHRTSEPAMIFFYDGDRWIREKDEAGLNYASYLVSVPVEHFIGYVCVYTDKMQYLQKDSNYVSYIEGIRDRRDYFNMRGESGSDYIKVKIGAAESTLRIKAEGSEPNRVPFIINTEAKYDSLMNPAGPNKRIAWEPSWTSGDEKTPVLNCVRFDYQGKFSTGNERVYEIHFVGVPDSLFYEYGNAVKQSYNGEFYVQWSTNGKDWKNVRPMIAGPRRPSENNQVFDSLALDKTAQYLRFTFKNAEYAAYLKNIKVTEFKRLYANPADSLIIFDTVVRQPGKYLTKYATLAWANLAPELIFDAKDPFSVKSRIKVRLDQFDTIFENNRFAVLESLDTIGEFYQRVKISSLDYTQPMATYVTINSKVIYDTEDMFAKVNGQDRDTIQYGDSAIITIQDKLGTTLFKHDSLILSYEYDSAKMSIDENGIVRDICVGVYPIVVKAADNSFVPGGWTSDTLYIDARENEKDSITFNFSSADEIAVHDTLTISALDTVAVLTITASEADALTQLDNNTFVIGNKTYSDSIAIYVKADSTCEHADNYDTIKIWVRGIVNPEFNASIPWMTNVFGNDTLYKPFVVLNEAKTDTINDQVTIAFEYTPDTVVVDTVEGQWYMRCSEDSLFIKVTVSSDSIKTVKDSIKFPVKEYIAEITWPGTVNKRGYYYVGDTLKVAEFTAKATNPEKGRYGKDLTNLVHWTKEFVEAADGTVLEDGSVLLDSVNTSVLKVCLDTFFVRDTCAYDTLIVKPAVVKDLFFPGVDSIYVVGDSIAVRDIVVKDTADRDISRYVRYNFAYIPEDFAHNTADSLNMFIKDTFTDFIVLDKNGLDTAAVDTVVSRTQGGLVTEKEFKDRLLIAPVYTDSVVWAKTVFTVGDTVRTSILTALDGKGNDVTRYSSFMFTFADGVAERINDTTIVMAKAGQVMVKVVAKRNESMHQGKFPQMLTVNPIKAKSVEGYEAEYKVFGALDTKTLVFRDSNDVVIPVKYIAATYVINEAIATQEGDNIVFNHMADSTFITANLAGNVVGELPFKVAVRPYDEAVIVYDTTAFVVGDEVKFNLFSVETADGKTIAKDYYTFAYRVSENDATINTDSTAMVMDSLSADLEITMISTDIDASVNPATFVIEAAKLTADRIEFPGEDYLVGQGFGINEIKVFDAKNNDITRYSENQLAFDYKDAEVRMSEDGDSIYFKKAGKIAITTTVGDLLINEKQFSNKMFVDQIQVDSILFPADTFTVDDTISATMFRVFVKGVEVTELVHDIRLSMNAEEGEPVSNGRYVFKKQRAATVTAEVRGISGSKPFEKAFTYTVAPIEGDRFVLPATEFKVLDQIEINKIKYFQGEKEITKYVKNALVTMPEDSATNNGLYITLDRAGQMTVTAVLRGNATGTLKQVITVDSMKGAIVMFKENVDRFIGDTLDQDDFYLVDAMHQPIYPNYGTFDITIDPAFGHKTGDVVILDKEGMAPIAASFNGDIVATPYAGNKYVGWIMAETIVFPSNVYTVGDTIQLDSLRVLDGKGQDITRYAQNGFFAINFEPSVAGKADLKAGYIVLTRPGTIEVNTAIFNDSVRSRGIKNELFVDNLKATSIVMPDSAFVVGQTLKISDIKVFAGDRDITAFSDINLAIDEKDGYGHYTAEGVVFDKKGAVEVVASLSGFTGVSTLSQPKTYDVAAIVVTDVNLPTNATVFTQIDTKNLIYRDAAGQDVTKYVESVEFAFAPENIARMDGDMMVFDTIGVVTVAVDAQGNAEGQFNKTISVEAFTDIEVKWNHDIYYIGDAVEPRDFTVVDKSGKLVVADYQLSISCEEIYGHQAGENIVLDTIGIVNVKVVVAGEVAKEVTLKNSVYPETPAFVSFPTDLTVGDQVTIDQLKLYTAKGKDITTYAYNVEKGRQAFQGFYFEPTNAASYSNETISFLRPGKVTVYTAISNTNLLYNTAAKGLPTDLFVKQLVADKCEMVENATVGDVITIESIVIKDAAGEVLDADKCGALDISFDANNAHFNEQGDIVLDRADKIDIYVKVQGQELVAYKEFVMEVDVAKIKADEFVLFNDSYKVFASVDTKNAIVKSNGKEINQYVDEITYVYTPATAVRQMGTEVEFIETGLLNVKVTVNGANVEKKDFDFNIQVNAFENAMVDFPDDIFYVGDELTTADFTVKNAMGEDITEYCTLSLVGAVDGKIVLETVDLNYPVSINVTGNVDLGTVSGTVKVVKCIAQTLVFPQGDYKVGDAINLSEIKVLDKNGKDITRYIYNELIDETKQLISFKPEANAHQDGNTIVLDHAGKLVVYITTRGEQMEMASATAFKNIVSVGQLTAKSVEFEKNYTVLDTLKLSAVQVFDANGEVTDSCDLILAIDPAYGYYTYAGDFVFTKATEPNLEMTVIVKGLKDVAYAEFKNTITVSPIAATRIEGIPESVMLYSQFDTKDIKVFAGTKDITRYAELTITLSDNEEEARLENGVIYFDKVGEINVNVEVGGSATGNFTDNRIAIKAYDKAEVIFPTTVYSVCDTLRASDFRLMANGQDVTSLATLSISCNRSEGTQMGEVIVLDKKQPLAAIKVTVSSTEFTITEAEGNVNVAKCEAAQVKVNAAYKVGDVFEMTNVQILDKNGKDITRFMTLTTDNFEFAPEGAAHLNGDIILDMAGKITVTTTVGSDLMADGKLNTIITVAQEEATAVTLTQTVFTVGEFMTMDNVAIVAGDKDLKGYADLSFKFDAGVAHMDGDKLVFDQQGQPIIITIVESGKAGVKAAEWPLNVTVNPIEAVDFINMEESYFVFDQFDTKNIQIVDAAGKAISYATFSVALDDEEEARLVDGIIYFDKSGSVDVTVTLTTDNVIGGPFTKTVTINKYESARVVFPEKNYVVSNIMNLSELSLVDEAGKKIENARITEFVIDADNEKDIEFVEGATDKIMFINVNRNALVKVAIEGEIKLTDAQLQKAYDVHQCVATDVVFPDRDYIVGDSIAIDELRVLDAVNTNITRFVDYLDITFADGKAQADLTKGYIYFLHAGTTTAATTLGGDLVQGVELKDKLIIYQVEAKSVELDQTEFTVGDTLLMSMVHVYDASGKEITDYNDLFFMPVANTHAVENGIVFDDITVKSVVVAIKGYNDVKKAAFENEVTVNPIEAVDFINMEENYFVFDQFDTKNIQIVDAAGKAISYATFSVALDDEEEARLVDGIIYFDKAGSVDVTVTLTTDNVIGGPFTKTVTINKYEGATVAYPTKSFYVSDVVNTADFRVVDAEGNDITNYAELSFEFADVDASFVSDSTAIMFDNAGDILVKVLVASNDLTLESQVCTFYVYPAHAADVIFPDSTFKATDSIRVADLIVKDSVYRDITRYVTYANFTFEPSDAASYTPGDEYIYILKSGNILVTTTLDQENNFKVVGGPFQDRLGVNQIAAAKVVLGNDTRIVGEMIDITMTKVYDEFDNDITDIAGQLLYTWPAGYAHFDENRNIIVDKVGENYITVLVEGIASVVRAEFVPELIVTPLQATRIEIVPADPYYVFGSIDTKDIKVYADDKDITNYAEWTVSFEPADNVKLNGTVATFDKKGDLTVNVKMVGNEVTGEFAPVLTILPYEDYTVVFPTQEVYHVDDMIYLNDVKVLDAQGNDITAYAELSFEGTVGANVDGNGNIILTKTGQVEIAVNVAGECKPARINEMITVSKYQIDYVTFTAPDYYVGQVLDEVRVFSNGEDMTGYAQIDYTYSPDSITMEGQQLKLIEAGYVKVIVSITGEAITDTTFTKILYVRRDQNECYDLLSLVWDDLMLVDNNNEDLPEFVNYVWYKDEVIIANQNTQDYYVRPEDKDGQEHIYYVRAFDADGNEYKICEKTYTFNGEAARRSFKVYPTLMTTADEYTVDASIEGNVTVTNANGFVLDQYRVESGKNSVKAPMAHGVYVLRYMSAEGQINTQKLIVK